VDIVPVAFEDTEETVFEEDLAFDDDADDAVLLSLVTLIAAAAVTAMMVDVLAMEALGTPLEVELAIAESVPLVALAGRPEPATMLR
jgi:hypothetical protein